MKFAVSDNKAFLEKFLTNIKNNKVELAKSESLYNFQPEKDVLQEIELAIQFIEFYMGLEVSQKLHRDSVKIQNRTYSPVFRVLVEIVTMVLAGSTDFTWKFSENQEKFITLLLSGLEVEYLGFDEKSFKKKNLSFTTMVITESCDLDSATDVLSKAWNNIWAPWVIRNVLVQESILPKFLALIKPKIKKFPEEYLKNEDLTHKITSTLEKLRRMGLVLIHNESDPNPVQSTIVQNVTREFFEEVEFVLPIVTLNVFRTSKEAVGLANSLSGGSASVWCENISMALEIVKELKFENIWINCNGLFNPNFPFQFSGVIYGSSAAIDSWFDQNKLQHIKVNSNFYGNTLFQTILEYDEKKSVKGFKTIVIPFGSTFAN